eukprot:1159751-Pelagomonas_calceolata.AAC.2
MGRASGSGACIEALSSSMQAAGTRYSMCSAICCLQSHTGAGTGCPTATQGRLHHSTTGTQGQAAPQQHSNRLHNSTTATGCATATQQQAAPQQHSNRLHNSTTATGCTTATQQQAALPQHSNRLPHSNTATGCTTATQRQAAHGRPGQQPARAARWDDGGAAALAGLILASACVASALSAAAVYAGLVAAAALPGLPAQSPMRGVEPRPPHWTSHRPHRRTAAHRQQTLPHCLEPVDGQRRGLEEL